MILSRTGKGQTNKPTDIAILQILFNQVCIYQKKDASGICSSSMSEQDGFLHLENLVVDGKSESKLIERIEAYQQAKEMKVVDGWMGPSGATIKALLADAGVAKGTTRMDYFRNEMKGSVVVSQINPITVTNLYASQYKPLSSEDKAGLNSILKTAKKDKDVTNIRELAYMLATTKHETAHTFRAISEYGKGSGRSYGKEIEVSYTNAAKKTTTYKNKYYGRGYVQLTWGYNYQRIDEKLGNGSYPNKNKTKAADYNKGFTISKPEQSIYLHPDKALNDENAYIAMVYGMQKGIFTGKKISNYISGVKTDYYNARRVINGTDKASDIARYAEDFEILLILSAQ